MPSKEQPEVYGEVCGGRLQDGQIEPVPIGSLSPGYQTVLVRIAI